MAKILEKGDVLRLEVSPQYANIQVIPKGNEGSDANFPRNLHNAAELFLRVGMVPNVVRLKETTDKELELYESPNNEGRGVKLGRACVCWTCGHCGIPKDYKEQNSQPPGPCFNCDEIDQVNWLRIVKSSRSNSNDDDDVGSAELPWIEVAPMTEKQAEEMEVLAEKDLAEKRAAVQARVQQALLDRDTTTATNQ